MGKGLALGAALALLTAAAYGGNDSSGEQIVKQGNGRGATACAACHGPDGGGNAAAGYPRLSMLNAGYLAAQLQAFRDGSRSNAVMQPIAKALDEQESKAVAEYYAKQSAQVESPSANDQPSLAQGQRLAKSGDWDHTIPACVSCHGPGGNGVGATFPALAGQHAGYIETQLQDWRQGKRKSDPNQLMATVAKRLNEAQIKAVASYFASLEPGR